MDNLCAKALDKAGMGMMLIGDDLRILSWNAKMERMSGLTAAEVKGVRLLDVCPLFSTPRNRSILRETLELGRSRFCASAIHKAFILPKGAPEDCEVRQNLQVDPIEDEGKRYALLQISDVTHLDTRVHKLKSLIREMTEQYDEIRAAEHINRHLALHDPLTGLPNRLLFEDRLGHAVRMAGRSGEKLAVMFLDLDGFKHVNDTHGHDAGDLVLREVAQRLRRQVRGGDTLARLGGDEFAVVLGKVRKAADASVVADHFFREFVEPFAAGEGTVALSVSIGISLFPKDGTEPQALLRKADQAMYRVKAAGKNAFAFA